VSPAPGSPLRQLRLRLSAAGPAALALLLLPLQGCGSLPGLPTGQSLHVLVVPTDRIEWMRNDIRENQALRTLVAAFRRLRPNVSVEISIESEGRLTESLRRSTARGLAPDLLLVRGTQAVSLLEHGLVEPLVSRDPRLEELRSLIVPALLHRVSTPKGLAGLPVFSEFTLACYDRRRLSSPPATLTDLLALAASGKPVGLSVDPTGIWWTAAALGAEQTLMPIITGQPNHAEPSLPQQQMIISGWLRWLREAALQSHVELASGPEDLTTGLESGRFAWVPCFSLTLVRLNRTMGRHLGVAPLPSGPDGPPSPFSSSRVWAMGRDSSPGQRQLAMEFAALSLEPMVQRMMMLQTRMLVPANRYVPIAVASSGELAALAQAQQQFERASALMTSPFSVDRLSRVVPQMETVLVNVMVGVLTPQQGSDALLRLRPHQRSPRRDAP
jgi:ABC-type glycerol-3-phosphate transport system substrate-binding protein